MPYRKRRVFLGFDFDYDRSLKDLLVGQARNIDSPFEISDWSMKEPAFQRLWEAEARTRIKQSDTVLVVLGHRTNRAPGVLKEIKIAHEEGKQIVQVIGHPDTNYSRVPGAGLLYRWTWDNLQKILERVWY